MTRPIPRFIPFAAMAIIALAAAPVDAAPLPPLIDFQSVLLDEGGNLLPSGATSIQFQILDENREPIYTETQSVDVVKGAASALIGNGTDSKGISTGGIPEDTFISGAPRYLQVQVTGHAPEDPMTIVPVPYAQWSQTCASVADGSVKPASIAKAAVGFESLAPDVIGKLAEQLSQTQGMMTAQALNASGGASQIGLQTKLINSGSATVQGALQDIDLSVKKRQEETTFLTGKLNEEVTNRTNAVKGVQDQLNMTTDSNMKTTISNLQTITSDINNIPKKLNLDKLDSNTSAKNDLNMGGKKITNLGKPEVDTDAVNKSYADQLMGDINNITGSLSSKKLNVETDLNMNTHRVTNLATPTDNADAVTKFYVDGAIAAANKASTDVSNELSASSLKTEEGSFSGDGNSKTITLPTITNLKQVHIVSDGAGPGGLTFWRMGNKVLTWGIGQNGAFAGSSGDPDGGTISATATSFTISNSQWNALGFTTYWVATGQ